MHGNILKKKENSDVKSSALNYHVPTNPTSCSSDLTLLSRIREDSGSNLGPETAYPDWGFSWFPQSIQANAGIVP
jgi:hypothetical protein